MYRSSDSLFSFLYKESFVDPFKETSEGHKERRVLPSVCRIWEGHHHFYVCVHTLYRRFPSETLSCFQKYPPTSVSVDTGGFKVQDYVLRPQVVFYINMFVRFVRPCRQLRIVNHL